ncbi:hypothetical protein ACHAWF_004130 [Thalassiosira exigua]
MASSMAMKWTLTATLFLAPVTSAKKARVGHIRDGRLDVHTLDRSGGAATAVPRPLEGSSNGCRSLEHGEKWKQRKTRIDPDNDEGSYVTGTPESSISTSTSSSGSRSVAPMSTSPTRPIDVEMASSESIPFSKDNANVNSTACNLLSERWSSQNKDYHRVSHIYTYGAPSVMKNPAMTNPGNVCVPGLRVFTEDVEVVTCSWWETMWCNETTQLVTNVDFASQINVKEGYPHAKMDTLVIKLVNRSRVEYVYMPCKDDEGVDQYNHQMWPAANLDSELLPGYNIHSLPEHYEARLLEVPYYVRGPALEYVSVARCVYRSTLEGILKCLNHYREVESPSRQGGVLEQGWELSAVMDHETSSWIPWDSDCISVFRNDCDPDHRRCIISFEGSNHLADMAQFVLGNADEVAYCGRRGVHAGIANELRGITSDVQYSDVIVPALQDYDEVSCVGHSLGGSLCQLFMYCANADPDGFQISNSMAMDDYASLVWNQTKQFNFASSTADVADEETTVPTPIQTYSPTPAPAETAEPPSDETTIATDSTTPGDTATTEPPLQTTPATAAAASMTVGTTTVAADLTAPGGGGEEATNPPPPDDDPQTLPSTPPATPGADASPPTLPQTPYLTFASGGRVTFGTFGPRTTMYGVMAAAAWFGW